MDETRKFFRPLAFNWQENRVAAFLFSVTVVGTRGASPLPYCFHFFLNLGANFGANFGLKSRPLLLKSRALSPASAFTGKITICPSLPFQRVAFSVTSLGQTIREPGRRIRGGRVQSCRHFSPACRTPLAITSTISRGPNPSPCRR